MRIDTTSAARDERGFGLIEVIIAMAILVIGSLSILPVFMTALKLSADNVSLTTATQLVSQNMDVARELTASCATLQQWADEKTGRYEPDPRGVVLELHLEVQDTCPTSFPAAFELRVWVTPDGDPDHVIAQAETRLLVTS